MSNCTQYWWKVSLGFLWKTASVTTGRPLFTTVKLYKCPLGATSSKVHWLISHFRKAPVTSYKGQSALHTGQRHGQNANIAFSNWAASSSDWLVLSMSWKWHRDSYSLFNLERILLASFLMSAIKSSRSAFVSARRGERSCVNLLLPQIWQIRCRGQNQYRHTPNGSECHLQEHATFNNRDSKNAQLALILGIFYLLL